VAQWKREPLEKIQRAEDAEPSDEKTPPINRGLGELEITRLFRPGDTRFRQSYKLVIANAVRVVPLGRMGDVFPVRVENPSGEAFAGTLAVAYEHAEQKQAASFAGGQRERTMTFRLPDGPMREQARLILSEGGLFGSNLVTLCYRSVPVPCSLQGLSLVAEGNAEVMSEQAMQPVAAPPGLPVPGLTAIELRYRFDPGWKYVCLKPNAPELQPIDGQPLRLGLWLKGDGSGNITRMRLVDSTGQTFQPDGAKLNFTDWRYMEFNLTGQRSGHWGGADDGKIHYPIKLETLLLIDSASRQKTEGAVYLVAPTLIYDR
jgi:hypothetical protein